MPTETKAALRAVLDDVKSVDRSASVMLPGTVIMAGLTATKAALMLDSETFRTEADNPVKALCSAAMAVVWPCNVLVAVEISEASKAMGVDVGLLSVCDSEAKAAE